MLRELLLGTGAFELAKAIHSTCGSIATVFLFTRLWARSNRYGGLWWDDYLLIASWAFLLSANGLAGACVGYGFNVVGGTTYGQQMAFSACSLMYIAIGLSKLAFAMTLHRLTAGKLRVLVWGMSCLAAIFTSAAAVITWLDVCEVVTDQGRHRMTSLPGSCVGLKTIMWIHLGNAVCTLSTDALFSILPWILISKIRISHRERWGVGFSMSLVGLTAAPCVARLVVGSVVHELTNADGQALDFTCEPISMYHGPAQPTGILQNNRLEPFINPRVTKTNHGTVVIVGLLQSEAAIYIVVQAIPTIRLLIVGGSTHTREAGLIQETSGPEAARREAAGPREVLVDVVAAPTSPDEIQLSSRKVVPVDSDVAREPEAAKMTSYSNAPMRSALD